MNLLLFYHITCTENEHTYISGTQCVDNRFAPNDNEVVINSRVIEEGDI